MKNLGEIRPSGAGRWVWPFRDMEEGDFFHVDPQLRRIQDVRNLVYSNGNRIGRKFKVSSEHGMVRVERVGEGDRRLRPAPFIPYARAMDRLQHLYELTGNEMQELPWLFLSPGESWTKLVGSIKIIEQRDLVVNVGGRERFHVELQDEGFTMTRLEAGMTLPEFLRQREEQKVLELMG